MERKLESCTFSQLCLQAFLKIKNKNKTFAPVDLGQSQRTSPRKWLENKRLEKWHEHLLMPG